MWKIVPMSVLLCALTCASVADDAMDVFRLPGTTKPLLYDLRIVPDVNGENSTFTGDVNITLKANATTNEITLNLKELCVTRVTVADITDTVVYQNVSQYYAVPRNEQFVIQLQEPLINNHTYVASVSFGGKIRDDLTGFYLSSYDESNATKWLAVTQFESMYARRAFPCYDEPALKAEFNVAVVTDKNQITLSNMPIKSVEIEKTGLNQTKMQVVYVEKTPPMSTYLVAFYVGDFVSNQNNSVITIYTHRDRMNQTQYAAMEAPKHYQAMRDYTGIEPSIGKLDLLAIPDFAPGAMENWGINTFQEYYLLLHPNSKTKMYILSSEIMQHEFTHQWFGNQVTCVWWDYLWLNEGFARYFQYFATGSVRTDWGMEELFVVESHQTSLANDQNPRQSAITSTNAISEDENALDYISYDKAASVLRMLRHFVTEELFKASLHNYLEANMYSATTSFDLFYAFDDVLKKNNFTFGNNLTVNEFMTNWTTQAGYPVLNIAKNKNTHVFSITQSRFNINATETNDFQAWHVGLTYTTKISKNFNSFKPAAWTNKQSNLTVLQAPPNSGWYIFNIQSSGFYRVNYDAANWEALANQLKDDYTAIHVLNRAQLIDDAFTLAQAGQLNYTVPLHLSKYLKNETSAIPFYSAIRKFAYLLERMPRHQSGYEKFKEHIGRIAGSIYNRIENLVSKGNIHFNVTAAWDTFATWACRLDHIDCTKKALEYFNKWQTGEDISADIKDAALCAGVKNSKDNVTFNQIFELFTTTPSFSEKSSAQLALGCSTDRAQLTEYLNHVFDGSQGPVMPKNKLSIANAIAVTPLGQDVMLEFPSKNINRVLNEVSDGEGIVKRMYSVLASKVTTDDEIKKMKYLKDNITLTESVKSSFDMSFTQVDNNLLWFDANGETVGQWAIRNAEEESKEQENLTVVPSSPMPPTSTQSSSPAGPTTTTFKPPPSRAPWNDLDFSLIVLQLFVVTGYFKIYIL